MKHEDLKRLSEPFKEEEIDWKVQRCGLKGSDPWAIVVPYVDARAIMDRLDEVAGPENWQTHLTPKGNGMLCELALRIDGNWVGKMDGSDETDYEAFKGGISKALVRAAVHWGIGRELYKMPNVFARFVERSTPGARFAKIEGKDFWWVPNLEPLEKAEAQHEEGQAKEVAKPATQATGPQPDGDPGESIVPFGHNQGKKLNALTGQELAGLADFYSRVPDPKGKARVFKQQFDRFVASKRSKAS